MTMEEIFDKLCEIEGILLNTDVKNNFKDLNYSEEERITKAVDKLRTLEIKIV